MVTLLVKSARQPPRRLRMDKDVLSIGRAPDNDLSLNDASASRHHGELVRDGTTYTVRDLNSRNGTFVNGARVDSSVVQPGDEIVIGETLLRLVAQDDSDDAPRADPVDEATQASGPSLIIPPVDHIVDVRSSPFARRRADAPAADAGEQERERSALLYHVGKAVLAARSFDELLDLAVSLVFDCVRAERGVLMLRDAATGEIAGRVARHREQGRLAPGAVTVPRSIVNTVVSREAALLTSDAAHDPCFERGESVFANHIRSALCVPLWDQERILGAIYVDSLFETYAFTDDDLRLLSAVANLIAIRLRQEQLNAELNEERVVRSQLERYHSPEVVDMILRRAHDQGELDLRLEEREVTVVFADVVGFTPLAERLGPSRVAALLNDYFDLSTRLIFEFGGTVNEYIGDSVVAIFGAPIAVPDHARRAVSAAVGLLRALAERRQSGGLSYNVRIGINTGPVVVGNIGSVKRLKYTVLGDSVNVAARLEKFGEPNTISLGENTYRLVEGDFPCTDLGPVSLRGRSEAVRVYRIDPAASPEPPMA